MTLATLLPLALAGLLCLPVVLSRVHDGVDRLLTRIAIGLFDRRIERSRGERSRREAALRAAQLPTTYREYGSRTLLFAGLFGVVGSILGIYAVRGVLAALVMGPGAPGGILPEPVEFLAAVGDLEFTPFELFALEVLACLVVGALVGGGVYALRWWYPGYVADARARRIDAALPSTIAFVYALSRSGMSIPEVIRIVAAQEDVYGEAAVEFGVAVRAMDTFGMDVVTALRTMSRRTPSTAFQEFAESLVSVLQSGHSLSAFLERQYHDAQEESESQQEGLLELLATLAESYVTVLIAGPLFLITLLVVIGIAVQETLTPLAVVVYVVVPLGNLAFVVYLSVITDAIDPGRPSDRSSTTIGPDVGLSRTDGGTAGRTDGGTDGRIDDGATARTDGRTAVRTGDETDGRTGGEAIERDDEADGGADGRTTRNRERLRVYRRLRSVVDRFGSPIATLTERPTLTVAITGPIAVAVVLWGVRDGSIGPSRIDDAVALSALFVLVVFAAFYERHRRWIDAVEAAIPDLLDRLASVNQAGMSLISGIDHVRSSDLGPLGAELERVWNDVQWGADLETALGRLDARVRTRSTSRVVTLLAEAMKASGDLAAVLRIAAREAATDRRLERKRVQAMREYQVVVYVAFLVFLLIIAVLAAYLFPNLPTETAGPAGAADEIGGLGGTQAVDTAAYATLFYHATLIQGALSGLVAGQLSTGDVRAGAKHAAVLIGLAVALFAIAV